MPKVRKDWSKVREPIERLYMQEKKPMKEVMQIVQKSGFLAS